MSWLLTLTILSFILLDLVYFSLRAHQAVTAHAVPLCPSPFLTYTLCLPIKTSFLAYSSLATFTLQSFLIQHYNYLSLSPPTRDRHKYVIVQTPLILFLLDNTAAVHDLFHRSKSKSRNIMIKLLGSILPWDDIIILHRNRSWEGEG